MGNTARVDNPTEEVIPTEEDRMDGPADVGVDTSHAGDADNSNDTTTTVDRGEAVELLRVQGWASASTEASTDGHMVTVCIRVYNVPHRKLDTSPIPPL